MIFSPIKTGNDYVVRLLVVKGRITPLKPRLSHESRGCTLPKLKLESVVLIIKIYQAIRRNVGDIPPIRSIRLDSQ